MAVFVPRSAFPSTVILPSTEKNSFKLLSPPRQQARCFHSRGHGFENPRLSSPSSTCPRLSYDCHWPCDLAGSRGSGSAASKLPAGFSAQARLPWTRCNPLGGRGVSFSGCGFVLKSRWGAALHAALARKPLILERPSSVPSGSGGKRTGPSSGFWGALPRHGPAAAGVQRARGRRRGRPAGGHADAEAAADGREGSRASAALLETAPELAGRLRGGIPTASLSVPTPSSSVAEGPLSVPMTPMSAAESSLPVEGAPLPVLLEAAREGRLDLLGWEVVAVRRRVVPARRRRRMTKGGGAVREESSTGQQQALGTKGARVTSRQRGQRGSVMEGSEGAIMVSGQGAGEEASEVRVVVEEEVVGRVMGLREVSLSPGDVAAVPSGDYWSADGMKEGALSPDSVSEAGIPQLGRQQQFLVNNDSPQGPTREFFLCVAGKVPVDILWGIRKRGRKGRKGSLTTSKGEVTGPPPPEAPLGLAADKRKVAEGGGVPERSVEHLVPWVLPMVEDIQVGAKRVVISPPQGLLELGYRACLLESIRQELLPYCRPGTPRGSPKDGMGEAQDGAHSNEYPGARGGEEVSGAFGGAGKVGRCLGLVMPSERLLRDQRRGDLVQAIREAGGMLSVAYELGLATRRRPNGYWENLDNLDEGITDFLRETCPPFNTPGAGLSTQGGTDTGGMLLGQEEDLAEWLYTVMPLRADILSAKHFYLHHAIEMSGGYREVAVQLGRTERAGKLQLKAAVARRLAELMKERGLEALPSSSNLMRWGLGDLSKDVRRVGGPQAVAELIGMRLGRHGKGHWGDVSVAAAAVKDYLIEKNFTPELSTAFVQAWCHGDVNCNAPGDATGEESAAPSTRQGCEGNEQDIAAEKADEEEIWAFLVKSGLARLPSVGALRKEKRTDLRYVLEKHGRKAIAMELGISL